LPEAFSKTLLKSAGAPILLVFQARVSRNISSACFKHHARAARAARELFSQLSRQPLSLSGCALAALIHSKMEAKKRRDVKRANQGAYLESLIYAYIARYAEHYKYCLMHLRSLLIKT
jgi:hypothetical protein